MIIDLTESNASSSSAATHPIVTQAWSLLSQLSSLGYITDVDYQRLHELRKQRNEAVHFTGRDAPDPADVEYVLDIVDRMLNGRYVPAD